MTAYGPDTDRPHWCGHCGWRGGPCPGCQRRDDRLVCPYCGASVASCEGERRSMRAHRIDGERCPASGLTIAEAQHVAPVERILNDLANHA